jgi:hypothetical protein
MSEDSRRPRSGGAPPRSADPGAPDPGAEQRWGSLYGGRPPTETGIGAATVRAQRRHRRRLLFTGIAALLVAGLVGFLLAPRWWWNPKDYGDHVGAGAYVDPTPEPLRGDLDAMLPELRAFVEKHRGLRFAATPPVVYLPNERFRAELSSHLAFEQRRYVGGATYDALGWHHTGETFNRLNLTLSSSNVEALYGDWDGMIYLRGLHLTPLAEAQITGLLTKALDDQTYNLAALYGPNAEQDERSAYDALVAGDMREVERAWVATRPAGQRCDLQTALRLPLDRSCRGAGSTAVTDPIAALIRFPDDAGLRFVSALRADGGTKAVDAAFAKPPRSSADILSVPHYRLDRSFRVVPFPPHAGRLVDFGTLGAYTLSLALAGGHPDRMTAASLVAGWRGDSFSTYRVSGRTCMRDTAVFDRPDQASRFAAQLTAAGWDRTKPTTAGGVGFTVCSTS